MASTVLIVPNSNLTRYGALTASTLCISASMCAVWDVRVPVKSGKLSEEGTAQ